MNHRYLIVLVGLWVLLFPDGPDWLQAQRRNEPATPVSITGRVLEEEGQPPQQLIQVNLVCGGRIRQQTLTAADGTFYFDWEPLKDEAWLDPGAGGTAGGTIEGTARVAPPGRSANLDEIPSMGRGRVSLSGCEVRVAPQPGFTSNVIYLSTRGSFDNPDVGVITLQRLADTAATTVSLSTLNAPKGARASYEKANQLLAARKPDFDRAIKQLQKAVREYPQFSAAWDLMARAHLSRGDAEEGRRCFLRAVEEEPKFILPYVGLAQLAVQQTDWKESAVWSAKVLELDSQHPQALYWDGLAAFYSNNFDRAGEALSQLYELGHAETFPFGLLPLGVILANQGMIQAAAERFDQYLRLMPADQVSEAQRRELRSQLDAWQSEGLATLPDEAEPSPRSP